MVIILYKLINDHLRVVNFIGIDLIGCHDTESVQWVKVSYVYDISPLRININDLGLTTLSHPSRLNLNIQQSSSLTLAASLIDFKTDTTRGVSKLE